MLTFTFIETKLFARLVAEYLSDDDYRGLQRRSCEIPRQAT
jgi:hypothetical protein